MSSHNGRAILRERTVYVKRKSHYLSYQEDPDDTMSLFWYEFLFVMCLCDDELACVMMFVVNVIVLLLLLLYFIFLTL
jgi:hypothetical protein